MLMSQLQLRPDDETAKGHSARQRQNRTTAILVPSLDPQRTLDRSAAARHRHGRSRGPPERWHDTATQLSVTLGELPVTPFKPAAAPQQQVPSSSLLKNPRHGESVVI